MGTAQRRCTSSVLAVTVNGAACALWLVSPPSTALALPCRIPAGGFWAASAGLWSRAQPLNDPGPRRGPRCRRLGRRRGARPEKCAAQQIRGRPAGAGADRREGSRTRSDAGPLGSAVRRPDQITRQVFRRNRLKSNSMRATASGGRIESRTCGTILESPHPASGTREKPGCGSRPDAPGLGKTTPGKDACNGV